VIYKKTNNLGFSLVEVMVVVGIMAVVSLGSATFIMNQNKAISFMEDRISRISFEQELSIAMNDRTSCLNAIGKNPLKKGESRPVRIENELGKVLFDPQANENTFEMLRLSEAQVTNISVKGPQSVGEVEISILVERMREGGGVQRLRPVTARFPVSTNNTGQFKNCYPTRSPICGDAIIVPVGKIPDPKKDYTNCCSGGGSLGDCITTGMESTPMGSSVFYICTCE